jgi:hypothetical protein
MPDLAPLDLALAAKRVRQPVETIADNAIDSLGARRDEDSRKLSCHSSGHAFPRTEAVVNDMGPGGGFILWRCYRTRSRLLRKFTRSGRYALLGVCIAVTS